jgi:hypothetical protein
MANRERKHPEYEVITTEERIRRDPRGLTRVTLLSDNLVIVKKEAEPYLLEGSSEQADEPTEGGEQ